MSLKNLSNKSQLHDTFNNFIYFSKSKTTLQKLQYVHLQENRNDPLQNITIIEGLEPYGQKVVTYINAN